MSGFPTASPAIQHAATATACGPQLIFSLCRLFPFRAVWAKMARRDMLERSGLSVNAYCMRAASCEDKHGYFISRMQKVACSWISDSSHKPGSVLRVNKDKQEARLDPC